MHLAIKKHRTTSRKFKRRTAPVAKPLQTIACLSERLRNKVGQLRGFATVEDLAIASREHRFVRDKKDLSPFTPEHLSKTLLSVDVRGLYIAMVPYSSLGEGAAVLTLGDIDIGETGERQNEDHQPTDDQTHIVDGMKME